MPEFYYSVRNQQGKKTDGTRDANSSDALAEQLQKEGLIPLEIKASNAIAPKEVKIKKPTLINLKLPDFLVSPEPPAKEIQMFCRQMYSLLKAGIPIITTITRLQETTLNKKLVQALSTVLITLNQGQSLSDGLGKCSGVFSEFFINLVRVGESSGQLDKTFLYLSEYIALEIDTKKKIKSAFSYPKMVSIAMLIALLVINIFVIPTFADLFKNVKGGLPVPTIILMTTSNIIINYWFFAIMAVVVAVLAFKFWVKTSQGKIQWAHFILKLPIVGWLVQRITLMRFAKLFAMVLRAGLTVVQGIELVGASTDNAYFAQKITMTSALIVRGNTLSQAIEQTKLFPPLMIQMVAIGEESGGLDHLLDEIADFYEREVAYDLEHLSEAIEPILLIFMGGMVLMLALGVFLPMWTMSNAVG